MKKLFFVAATIAFSCSLFSSCCGNRQWAVDIDGEEYPVLNSILFSRLDVISDGRYGDISLRDLQNGTLECWPEVFSPEDILLIYRASWDGKSLEMVLFVKISGEIGSVTFDHSEMRDISIGTFGNEDIKISESRIHGWIKVVDSKPDFHVRVDGLVKGKPLNLTITPKEE